MKNDKNITSKIPTRKCLVSGARVQKKDLMRFVVAPEQYLVADIDQKLPGRGYWVKADRNTITKAITKNILFKAVTEKVKIDLNVLEVIERQIKDVIIQQISLSRKAGRAIFGFDKIKANLAKNSINLLIQAKDGSTREKQRILKKSIPHIIDDCLIGTEIGKAFGRERVVHCGIIGNDFIEKIIFNANRLNNFKNPLPHYDNMEKSDKN